ncbi:UDP-N-acetylmuramoyl-L-alanyl-D-glutamate--2,6-diaminopimelate ligase [Chloroflexota bacterium]
MEHNDRTRGSSVRLKDILESLPDKEYSADLDIIITGVTPDSRRVNSGVLFVAVKGGTADGHHFIPNAIKRGASAVIGTQVIQDCDVPYIRVSDSRLALANASAAYHDFPSSKLVMIGITGTDGKTTTANLIFNILQIAGFQTGMISTVNAVIGEETLDTGFHVTTPDASELQSYLAQMVETGITHVILEATSHGLAQHRLSACEFDIAVITNIAHEHLDYHGTYREYRAAKARLFTALERRHPKRINPERGAVLNIDDISFQYLSSITSSTQITYGIEQDADVKSKSVRESISGLDFIVEGYGIHHKSFSFPVFTPLIGRYNISNCLAAIATTKGILDLPENVIQKGISTMAGVPGRMERIKMGQEFIAIIDFAHTPNALKNALTAARSLTAGKVIAVFGSAGLRDKAKRRLMAEISAELADLTILTAEDPRTESLQFILSEMAEGLQRKSGVEGDTFWRIPDRGEAIRLAVEFAEPGDLIIACGKGHEQSMCFGETEYTWDDRIAMRAALSEQLEIPGPEMPFLPTHH